MAIYTVKNIACVILYGLATNEPGKSKNVYYADKSIVGQ